MGADLIEHEAGEFSRAVFVKGGSGDPSTLPGTIDSVAVAPTFTVASLAGYGDDYFDSWYAYVAWDKGGAAAPPQGESQTITGYTSATGIFAHAAFTVPLVAGDKVLISLSDPNATGGTATVGNQTSILADIGDASAATLSSLYGILGNPSASIASTILDGIDGRVNNANLNALLGIPDVAGKPLYTCLVTDRLDHATYGLSALDTKIGAIPVGIKKNVQRTIVFKMVDATDFATPETGITVVEEISKDGGAFTACTNTFAEIANGWYKITLTATEMNASEIIFKGTGAGCAQCDRLIITEA